MLPDVTICYTQTLDGRLATASGESQWIGAGESVAYWHQLRADHDAVMVGIGTVLADNPRLTVRHVAGRDPLRVVVDSHLRTPETAALRGPGTLFAVGPQAGPERVAAFRAAGALVEQVPQGQHGLDLAALLAVLAERGIRSVMVEGGAQLITALLRQRLAGRAVVCVAPRLMGSGTEAIGDIGVRRLSDMPALVETQVRSFGPDIVFTGKLVYPM